MNVYYILKQTNYVIFVSKSTVPLLLRKHCIAESKICKWIFKINVVKLN